MRTELILGGVIVSLILLSRRGRHNPSGKGASKKARSALAQSLEFHGSNEVIELSEKERLLPKYLVGLGYIPELRYEPRSGSKRGDATYIHESGDKGPFTFPSREKPFLAADPESGRPVIVRMKSKMKFEPDRGLVG